MPTYYIRTPLPLDDMDRAIFAGHHFEKTGNQLAVVPNAAGTECLVKVNCDCDDPNMILPVDFVPTEIITDIEVARALLNSENWTTPS